MTLPGINTPLLLVSGLVAAGHIACSSGETENSSGGDPSGAETGGTGEGPAVEQRTEAVATPAAGEPKKAREALTAQEEQEVRAQAVASPTG